MFRKTILEVLIFSTIGLCLKLIRLYVIRCSSVSYIMTTMEQTDSVYF